MNNNTKETNCITKNSIIDFISYLPIAATAIFLTATFLLTAFVFKSTPEIYSASTEPYRKMIAQQVIPIGLGVIGLLWIVSGIIIFLKEKDNRLYFPFICFGVSFLLFPLIF